MAQKTFIIAEAGVNHNGDIKLAKALIDAAAEAGADCVKFQTWKTELLVTPTAKMAQYQIENTSNTTTQFEMLKSLELSYTDFVELKDYCDNKNIIFMSTPDETQSATFLNNLQNQFKIGSGELTNLPFLSHIASFRKPIILSTGMSNLTEIELALNTLKTSGITIDMVTILHATTQYPTPMQEVNLLAMNTIKNAFPGVKVGYSDHTLGIEIPIAAVAMGATIIEKHFTLDKKMSGPDHKASLNPVELCEMVSAIRNLEVALGTGIKEPSISELQNIPIVRKSIVASKPISKGQKLTEDNLTIMRPGTGIPPSRWSEILGTTANMDYQPGELIK
ncbi:N-acetylneuraminate synthase [Shewanella xiamenensis]|uniref:N-acetylneuraminate synthase n=1 Tax=Shewanella xiamenensis TaxID=332186 RepID=UPI0016634F60|nr:N-acetylneuraminate synthase [Shewanella xiamenensis]MCL1069939.1 N-acetylneuraminate synthase [Shewanella xiamenensis]WHF56853.1 N-acetylneuraminate synthase [Shewanella xiamenensis]GGM84920.1 N-acetylneuraminate synthase [Shewanella xiamenensis]